MELKTPFLIFDREVFENRKPGTWHPSPMHDKMIAMLIKKPLGWSEIERRYHFPGMPLIQPDCTDTVQEILNNLVHDGFIGINENNRYFFQSNLPFDGKCHSTIQYGHGGLVPVKVYVPRNTDRQKITAMITENGGSIGKRDIMRTLRHLKAADLEIIENQGWLVVEKIIQGRSRPRIIYKLKDSI